MSLEILYSIAWSVVRRYKFISSIRKFVSNIQYSFFAYTY